MDFLNQFEQDIVNYICDDDDIKAVSFVGSNTVSQIPCILVLYAYLCSDNSNGGCLPLRHGSGGRGLGWRWKGSRFNSVRVCVCVCIERERERESNHLPEREKNLVMDVHTDMY